MLRTVGLALIGAALAFILKVLGWKGAPLLSIASIVVLCGVALSGLESLFSLFDLLAKVEGVGKGVECVLKILGISYGAAIASDICRELGEMGIASAINTVARIESLAVVSPMIVEVITLGLELVQ
ncbi:MAG: hypothetical protein IKV16_02895 [Clostridia bacterium]|nr:hypothetical protein [Clostridia bacterium]